MLLTVRRCRHTSRQLHDIESGKVQIWNDWGLNDSRNSSNSWCIEPKWIWLLRIWTTKQVCLIGELNFAFDHHYQTDCVLSMVLTIMSINQSIKLVKNYEKLAWIKEVNNSNDWTGLDWSVRKTKMAAKQVCCIIKTPDQTVNILTCHFLIYFNESFTMTSLHNFLFFKL